MMVAAIRNYVAQVLLLSHDASPYATREQACTAEQGIHESVCISRLRQSTHHAERDAKFIKGSVMNTLANRARSFSQRRCHRKKEKVIVRRKVVWSIALTLLSISCVGCGNSNGMNPVYGKVLYKNEPAVGATVYFHRKGVSDPLHEQVPMGVIQEDGSFALASPGGDGALAGDYIVTVEWKEGAGKKRGRSPGLDAPDRLKGRYLNLRKPLLQAEIKPGTNRLSPFELN